VQVAGTARPLHGTPELDPLDFRCARSPTARLLMPRSVRAIVRRPHGHVSDAGPRPCVFPSRAANSHFLWRKSFDHTEPGRSHDEQLFTRLGLQAENCRREPALNRRTGRMRAEGASWRARSLAALANAKRAPAPGLCRTTGSQARSHLQVDGVERLAFLQQ
jgi:hypothetical protein